MEPTNKPRVAELKAGAGLEPPVENALGSDKITACPPPPHPSNTPTGLLGCRNHCRLVVLVCLLIEPITLVRATKGDVPPSSAAPPTVQLGGDRRPSGSLALKRPRPGSIWQGPKDVWCTLPPGQLPNSEQPGELQSESDEQSDPAPDTFLSPPALSSLLLFLTMLPTLEEVASYFAEALGEVPVLEGQQKLRFERWLVFVWGNSWRRCVLSGSARGASGVTVDWWTNDDFGLSELREFFEAPFFLRCESERFYQWLAEGGAHEADFRGHHLRMAVRKRDGVLFVRIQWWRTAHDADTSEAPLNLDAPLPSSNLTHRGLGRRLRHEDSRPWCPNPASVPPLLTVRSGGTSVPPDRPPSWMHDGFAILGRTTNPSDCLCQGTIQKIQTSHKAKNRKLASDWNASCCETSVFSPVSVEARGFPANSCYCPAPIEAIPTQRFRSPALVKGPNPTPFYAVNMNTSNCTVPPDS